MTGMPLSSNLCGHGVDLSKGDCDDCRADDHDRYVRQIIGQAECFANDTERALNGLRNSIAELTNGPAWDIELAESSDGPDALNELEQAARHLRHVRRIVVARVRLMKQEGRDQ